MTALQNFVLPQAREAPLVITEHVPEGIAETFFIKIARLLPIPTKASHTSCDDQTNDFELTRKEFKTNFTVKGDKQSQTKNVNVLLFFQTRAKYLCYKNDDHNCPYDIPDD